MLIPIDLLNKAGELVQTIQCIAMEPMPDIVMWSERHFIRNDHGQYIEGFCVAVFTEEEYEFMKREGIIT